MSDCVEPEPELRRRQLAAGEARVAVFRRTYSARIADVWDACTDPERLARWYVPVNGMAALLSPEPGPVRLQGHSTHPRRQS